MPKAQLLASVDAPFTFHYVEGVEDCTKYRSGGYHPTSIGDTLHGRYNVVDKLGYGGSSTVWLAYDTYCRSYVAVKIGTSGTHNEDNDHDTPHSEIDILRELTSSSVTHPIEGRLGFPQLLDEFTIAGPNGTHPCFTSPVARSNLTISKFDSLFTQQVARAICYRLASVVAWIHARGYVHGDIRLANVLARMPSTLDELSTEEFYKTYGDPETILVAESDQLPPGVPKYAIKPLRLSIPAQDFALADAQVILNDYGEAFLPSKEPRHASTCRTPYPERPPESTWDPSAMLLFSSDIWTLAVTFWDVLGLTTLFYSVGATEDDIFAQQIEMLGHSKPPDAWMAQWARRKDFIDDGGTPVPHEDTSPPLDSVFETYIQRWRRKSRHPGCEPWSEAESQAILSLLRQMLAFQPEERPTAEQILASPWMTEWCRPDFEQSLYEASKL